MPQSERFNPIWGPYQTCYKGHSLDSNTRHLAASGGALSGFLVSLLTSGQVDGVIHVRADKANPLANATTVSHTTQQVLNASGSRYAPSSPLDILHHIPNDGRRYAFVGKPCDISALHALRKIDSEIARMVPILVSFFCAGVPSLRGGQKVLKHMGLNKADVLSFQHRAEGWPGQATAKLHDGSQRSMSYEKSWGTILSKEVQHRCKICADGSGLFADVVFADVWEANASGYPSFEDRPGQSLVLCRTQLGEGLVYAARSAGHLKLSTYALDKLAKVQPGQTRRRRALLARLAALWLMGRPIPRYRGMGLWQMARHAPLRDNFRNFAGMLRRAWRAQRSKSKEEQSC